MGSPKKEVQKILAQLSDDSSFEDTQYHIYVRDKIERGQKDIESGNTLSQKEVEQWMSRWIRVLIYPALSEKRDQILEIAKKHGAHNLRIFGSVARGDFHKGSDVDVLVKMESGRTLLDLVALWQELEELLDCKVDVITEEGMSPYLRDRILAEAIPL